jgi:hypothetical protein
MGLFVVYMVLPRGVRDRVLLFIAHPVLGIHASCLVLNFNHLSEIALQRKSKRPKGLQVDMTKVHAQSHTLEPTHIVNPRSPTVILE